MRRLLLTALCIFIGQAASAASPADSSLWTANLRGMQKAELDTAALAIRNLTLEHHDFTLTLDTGTLYPARPIMTESGPVNWAYLFRGQAHFRFVPPVSIERDQIRRFYKVDSLDKDVNEVIILCDSSFRNLLDRSGVPTGRRPRNGDRNAFDEHLAPLIRDENHAVTFSLLRAIAHPRSQPYLLVLGRIEGRDRTAYMYDPYRREPIVLLRDHSIPGERFLETICSYVPNLDESYATINGQSTDQLSPRHIDIDGVISGSGKYDGRTTISYDALDSHVQFFSAALHEELEVDSVIDHTGEHVPFVRYESDRHKSEGLYLVFRQPLNAPDTLSLTYFYHGDIAKREVGEFKVSAGASWYPRSGYGRSSTYTARFRTPKDVTFLFSGDLVDSVTVNDTLFTSWRVDRPTRNVSFNIGYFTRYEFGEPDGPPIELYYNDWLHMNVYEGSGRNTYKDVGRDVAQSVRLFSHLFGPFPFDRLVIGEIIFMHGESFPGFIHMGANTFISTDNWGEDHIFRAHEVAHQWWGSSLGTETYHDQWLSEGFATYASLLYLQQVKGDDRYYDKLKEYADDIFSARKYLFFDGAESGPVILGRRTASTRTEGDYSLIIYKKGAFVLHMLRTLLTDWDTGNDSRFFEMMQEFYRTYRDRTASTGDFRLMVERYTGTDMNWFFDQWVYHNELPEYRFVYDIESGDSGRQAWCTVTLETGPERFRTLMPIEIRYDDRRVYRTVWLEGRRTEFVLPLDGEVDKIVMNPFTAVLARVKQ